MRDGDDVMVYAMRELKKKKKKEKKADPLKSFSLKSYPGWTFDWIDDN